MQRDRFTHIGKGLVTGLTLTDAARKTWNFRDHEAIFAGI